MGQFKILEIDNPQNTHSDLTIIDFINAETEYFINNNIQKIAQKCYVSTASISRFANKNGFQTFRKLQQYVYEKNEWQKNIINYQPEPNSKTALITLLHIISMQLMKQSKIFNTNN
ncbi:hypothetical protein [Spiroplasma eriocheiris]|uniref:hypothetical protein n=1 Tax=Spiroplasma eriocheiris TaxID=315358 RepID=UPI00093D05E3|nr:hypothetical protein [Spiroplasma eriocheiris]AHF58201.1 hypothetical protein SPE_1086 [Spiroplasma eriocheiris CCTCC M 207170]